MHWPRGPGKLRRQKAIGLVKSHNGIMALVLVRKTTTLYVHHAFLYISLPSQQDYDVKWPNLSFFEDGNGEAINSTLSVWTRAWPPLFSSSISSLLLSNWVTWDNRETVWKDAEPIFQLRFHGRRHCSIVRSQLGKALNLFRYISGPSWRQITLPRRLKMNVFIVSLK